jgi:hypothetical protein
MKFRVLRGNHAEGKYPKDHPWVGRSIVYEIGEIVDSKTNLARFNSSGPLGPKFQRIYDATPATDKAKQGLEIARRREAEAVYDDGNGPHGPPQPLPDDGLEAMTLAELKKLAKEEGVNWPPSATQEDLVRLIREAPANA